MRTRRLWPVLALLLLPAAARADRHKEELYFGVSRSGGSDLWGAHVSGAYVFGKKQDSSDIRRHPLSVAGEISYQSGSHDGDHAAKFTLLGGPRYTHPLYAYKDRDKYGSSLFGHVLVGAVWATTGPVKRTDVAAAFGGGMDVFFSHCGGFRVQADFIVRGGADHFGRVSAGLVYRFEKECK